jgi:hypothetical protein
LRATNQYDAFFDVEGITIVTGFWEEWIQILGPWQIVKQDMRD